MRQSHVKPQVSTCIYALSHCYETFQVYRKPDVAHSLLRLLCQILALLWMQHVVPLLHDHLRHTCSSSLEISQDAAECITRSGGQTPSGSPRLVSVCCFQVFTCTCTILILLTVLMHACTSFLYPKYISCIVSRFSFVHRARQLCRIKM